LRLKKTGIHMEPMALNIAIATQHRKGKLVGSKNFFKLTSSRTTHQHSRRSHRKLCIVENWGVD